MKLAPWVKCAVVTGLILAALWLRLYNLPNSLQFQGDQGRDAIIVADIFREKDPVFIGPVTSVGNMYLGPLYYYFMLPFLWLTYPSPLGPVYAVAILGVITAYLVYRLGRELIGERGALIALFFYVFSAVIIEISRFSWNPNPAPFVSLLMIYATYLAWTKSPRYWIGVAVCFSVLVQLHYLTLLTLPAAGLIWLADAIQRWKSPRRSFKTLIAPTIIGALIFLASLTPLVLFDLKHHGLNAQAFQELVSSGDNFQSQAGSTLSQLMKPLKETEGRSLHILFEYMIGRNRGLNRFFLYSTVVIIATSLINKHTKKQKTRGEWVLLSYLLVGIMGTAFYEHTIFDHYIAYLFPVTALLYGYVLTQIKPWFMTLFVSVLFTGYFLNYNIQRWPLDTTGWTITDIQHTSQAILERIEPGERYNIVLLSESGDIHGQNYRYFLTTGHTRPMKLEDQGDIDTLFIIDEEKTDRKVTDSPIYEIVVFPEKTPAEVFQIEEGPEITVLRRTVQESGNGLE